jgi:cholinesterase
MLTFSISSALPPAQGMVSHVPSIARKLLNLYPDIPSLGVPAFLGNERISTLGMQWRRSSAYVGDEFQQAPRRKVCETWSSWSVPAYCFRFDSWGALTNWPFGAGHGQEVPFVFKNLEGTGYGAQNPFNSTNIHLATNLRKLSTTMATMWVNFIVDLNPNGGYAKRPWPKYKQGGENLMVLDANFTSGFTILRDDYRKEALEYINSIPSAYFR